MIEKINISGTVLFDEPMSRHTSYRIGGPADVYTEPLNEDDLARILDAAVNSGVKWSILGGGSNILVSDDGIRGIVIDTCNLRHLVLEHDTCRAGSGLAVSDVAEYCGLRGLGGLETFYAMPGTIGGAVWMNARCYGVSISDILLETRMLTPGGDIYTFRPSTEEFGYKRTPFQATGEVILGATFRVGKADPAALAERMAEVRADRESKGHFTAPCAGSVFKNNREFGNPSGKIIDSLGLRGFRIGDAVVSPRHANFIINAGSAKAGDVKAVIDHVQSRVKEAYGFELEPEVLFVGEWKEER